MPQRSPPLASLKVSLVVDRHTEPLEKICDSLDPLLQGKTMDALGLSGYELNNRVVTMKQQLRSLENTFDDRLRTEQEARDSEAKTFLMARRAYVEQLDKFGKFNAETARTVPKAEPDQASRKIAKLTEQLEQSRRDERKMKEDLDTTKTSLVAAEKRNQRLVSKLEEQVRRERGLEEKLEQTQRDLEETRKKCEDEREYRRREADRFNKAREIHRNKMKAAEEQKVGAIRLSDAAMEHMETLSERVQMAEEELSRQQTAFDLTAKTLEHMEHLSERARKAEELLQDFNVEDAMELSEATLRHMTDLSERAQQAEVALSQTNSELIWMAGEVERLRQLMDSSGASVQGQAVHGSQRGVQFEGRGA